MFNQKKKEEIILPKILSFRDRINYILNENYFNKSLKDSCFCLLKNNIKKENISEPITKQD